jgi:hypothetical protein
MTIEEWIEEQEGDGTEPIEEFYRGIAQAIVVLQERMELAEMDGVNLDEL